jgi:hypothetical protein
VSGGGGGSNEVKETEAEKAQNATAVKMWNHYQQTFAPLEDRLAGEVRTSPGERAQAEGLATAATAQQFAPNEDKMRTGLFAHGFNPGSPGFAAHAAGLHTMAGQSAGGNAAATANALSNNEAYGLLGVSQLGRGDTDNALKMGENAAREAQNQAQSDAQIALNKSLARNQLIGGALGAGAALGEHHFTQQSPGLSEGVQSGLSVNPSGYREHIGF